MSRKGLFYLLIGLTLLYLLLSPLNGVEKGLLIHLDKQNTPPSWHAFFGTDDLGRDLFSRCLFALKTSVIVGLCATFIDMTVGAFYGAAAALLPPRYAGPLTRFLDVMTILPQMLLSILVLMIVKHGFYSLIIAISLTGWISTARVMRAEILKLKTADFIVALKDLGFKPLTIFFKHLFPSCYSTLLVSSALCLPQAIFSEAFMSFLGLGLPPPFPSLGNMIGDGLPALRYYPWRLFFPASLVFALIYLSFTLCDSLKRKLGHPV